MPLVSVILPVYNGELYIEQTLRSILEQSFDDFEVLVIDDGSKDNSVAIVRKIADTDKRVRIITQTNKGICAARNTGIMNAASQYLMFCDHDDLYLAGYIQQAYRDISGSDYDFVKYGCRELYVDNNKIYKSKDCILADREYKGSEVAELVLAYSCYNEYLWDGIYKKELVESVGMFDPWFRAGCEDIDFMMKIIKEASSCRISSTVFYEHYIRKSSSTSRKYSENTYEAVLKMYGERLSVASGEHEAVKQYIRLKSDQFLWALLGMFSFQSCMLDAREISGRLKKVDFMFGLRDKLSVKGVHFSNQIVIMLFKMKMYGLLARVCILKRGLMR